jgi:hypothetical protein
MTTKSGILIALVLLVPFGTLLAAIYEIASGKTVLVETDQQKYQRNQEIIVTITNDLDTSITTFDQQAFCTIIRLEQQIGTEWKEVKNCISGVPSRPVTLEPHKKVIVKLPSLTPGIYLASIIFSLGETFNFGKSFIASSTPFHVQ